MNKDFAHLKKWRNEIIVDSIAKLVAKFICVYTRHDETFFRRESEEFLNIGNSGFDVLQTVDCHVQVSFSSCIDHPETTTNDNYNPIQSSENRSLRPQISEYRQTYLERLSAGLVASNITDLGYP